MKPQPFAPIRRGLALVLFLGLALGLPGPQAGLGAGQEREAADSATDFFFYLPVVEKEPPWTLTANRQASLDLYKRVYAASEGVPSGWSGDPSTCSAGTTSDAFREAIKQRINYFRSMAGIPPILELSGEYNRKAQQAALMMSVNGQLDHAPPTTWTCYTAEGAEAAGSSDLFLGIYGPQAISGYIFDPGDDNYPVGHRRWILYPQTQAMGSGDVPPNGKYPAANALWVFDDNIWASRPATREEFVAWPPPGYVPYPVVFERWSFSYAEADFSTASVSMSLQGQPIAVALQPVVNGYGENTLVWEPVGLPVGAPVHDLPYAVTLSGVRIGADVRNFSYQVTVFDPGAQPSALGAAPEAVPGPAPLRPAREAD